MRRALVAVALACALAACDPFGLPATRALERGAADTLSSGSLELKGGYTAAGSAWTIDLQLSRPGKQHMLVSNGSDTVEAIVIGDKAYFRGRQFLVRHLTDPRSQSLVAAAGDSWWKGLSVALPKLPELTDAAAFATAFLGQAVSTRTDHHTISGVDAVELSGARADVYIASAPPYPLLRVVIRDGAKVDGITDADLYYSDAGSDFGIAAPSGVLDFSNVSTLPPIYTVDSVDTSGCGSPCTVSARVRNLGGLAAARAPSTVKFTMADPVSDQVLGTCLATIQPDVGFNVTTSVSCTISGQPVNAATVTAIASNPGRG
jgi:hypothetical protein